MIRPMDLLGRPNITLRRTVCGAVSAQATTGVGAGLALPLVGALAVARQTAHYGAVHVIVGRVAGPGACGPAPVRWSLDRHLLHDEIPGQQFTLIPSIRPVDAPEKLACH